MRRMPHRLLLAAVGLALLAALWLWWNHPRPADMAGYVPADSLIYIEANDLPGIAGGIVSTDAWQALAPRAGVNSDFGRLNWLGRIAAWTGIGPAEAVVLARAQVAITVLGFDTAEEPADGTLKIKPRVALIAETHTSPWRVRSAVEKLVGDFARRAYGSPRIERKENDDVTFITWSGPAGKRPMVAAIMGSVAVVGNDEATVQACLAVRQGERPSLAGDPQLEEMRGRVDSRQALAFGYVSQPGARKLLEVAAIAYGPQLTPDPHLQSGAAVILPQLASKILGGAAWSARFAGGRVEDSYFLALQNGIAPRLRDAFAASNSTVQNTPDFVPADTYQLTRYNFRDPEAAWRGLNAAISSQLEIYIATLAVQFLEKSLRPFGIERPSDFLRVVGPEIATARLDDSGASTVLIAAVRDREALRAQLLKQFGSGARTLREGDAEMIVAANKEHGMAVFIANYVLLGAAEDVRRCLKSHTENRTLATTEAFQRAARSGSETSVQTFTDDTENARAFISIFAKQRATRQTAVSDKATETAAGREFYAVSETELVESGFQRKTRSAFGQFGALAAQFIPSAGGVAEAME